MIYGLLSLIFVGYHLYRWKRAEPHRQPKPTLFSPPQDAPKVSFLVPAWHAAEDIPLFVASFRALSYPTKELVLCAGGTDHSFAVARGYAAADIKVLEQQPGEGKQRALAKSFPLSSGTIIYLSDIDCRLSDEVVHTLIAPLLAGQAEVVTGASRPLDEQLEHPFVLSQWAVERMGQPQELRPVEGILGRNAALKRELLGQTQAFSVPAPSGTDYTLAKELLRAGYRIYFVPGAPIPSAYPKDIKTYVKKQARWIRNVYTLGQRYGAHKEVRASLLTLSLPHLLLALLVLGLVFTPLAFLALLGLAHTLINRLHYQRRAGLRLPLSASLQHVVADQVAALRATWQVLRGKTTW